MKEKKILRNCIFTAFTSNDVLFITKLFNLIFSTDFFDLFFSSPDFICVRSLMEFVRIQSHIEMHMFHDNEIKAMKYNENIGWSV